MSKVDKKKRKIQERIEELEQEMLKELKQKTSSTPEISISFYQERIERLRRQLESL